MSRVARHAGWGAALAVASAVAGVACGWEEVDALLPAPGGGSGGTGGDATAPDGGSPPDRVPEGDSATSSPPDGGSTEAASSMDDGTAGDLPCNSSIAPVRAWTFDSDTEGWTFLTNPGVSGGLSWAADAGDPAPGALTVTVTAIPDEAGALNGGWVEFQATPLGNLTGRVISAWVWLESDTTPNVKLYVQTGTQFTWADNGTVQLQPRVWTCVSMATSSPSYTNGPDYDPQNVVRVGFEMLGPTPFEVFVDSVEYR